MLFSSINLISSRIILFVSGYRSIQYFTASKPSLCGILENTASISNDASMVSFGMVFGRLFKKSVISLK